MRDDREHLVGIALYTDEALRESRFHLGLAARRRASIAVSAIVGAVLGAFYGREGIPPRWIDGLVGRTSYDDDGRVFELIDKARKMFWE